MVWRTWCTEARSCFLAVLSGQKSCQHLGHAFEIVSVMARFQSHCMAANGSGFEIAVLTKPSDHFRMDISVKNLYSLDRIAISLLRSTASDGSAHVEYVPTSGDLVALIAFGLRNETP